MKKSILLFLAFVISFSLMAQDTQPIKIIHLEDGSKLKGIILNEQEDQGTIEFQIIKGPNVIISKSI